VLCALSSSIAKKNPNSHYAVVGWSLDNGVYASQGQKYRIYIFYILLIHAGAATPCEIPANSGASKLVLPFFFI